jgi:hypothetical protein
MNTLSFGFNLTAMSSPEGIEDLIALAMEAREEMGRINGLLDALFEDIDCPVD